MKILSVSLDFELSQLRKAVLAAAGHDVSVITSEKEAIERAQSADSHDMVLICHHFPAAAARKAVRLLRQYHPGTCIVYVAHVYGEWPEVEADRYIAGADGAEALLRVVREVQEESLGGKIAAP